MDFDILTESPEFASVMHNPMSLVDTIEGKTKHTRESSVLAVSNKDPNYASNSPLTPDLQTEGLVIGEEGLQADSDSTEQPLPVEASSAPSPEETEFLMDHTDHAVNRDDLAECKRSPVLSSRDLYKDQVILVEGSAVTLSQPSPKPTDGTGPLHTHSAEKSAPQHELNTQEEETPPVENRSRHKRIVSSTPIPLKLPLSSPGNKSNNQADSARPAAHIVKSDRKGKRVDFSTWAAEVSSSRQELTRYEPEVVASGHKSGTPSTSDSQEFASCAPSDDGQIPNQGKHTYHDLVLAIASVKSHLQRLEDRLVLHERECATEMAEITHRSGGSWSGSNKQAVTRTIATASSSPKPLASAAGNISLPQPSAPSGPTHDTVRNVVGPVMRDYSELPPRVAAIRLREMVLDLTRASDASDYSALPHTLDQAREIVTSVSVGAAIKRMS